MKDLLIVTRNFPPYESIGTQRIIRILKYVDKSKWRVFVLTVKEKYCSSTHSATEENVETPLRGIEVTRTEKLDVIFYLVRLKNAIRDRIKVQKGVKNNRKKRKNKLEKHFRAKDKVGVKAFLRIMIDKSIKLIEFPDKEITWLPFAVCEGWKLIRRKNIQVIFSSSPSHSIHLITTILKILTGKKLVIEFRDPWARSPWRDEERSSSRVERLKHQMVRTFEKWVVEKADRVVCVSPEMRNDFVSYYSYLSPQKFMLFYNGYDPDNLKFMRSGKNRKGKEDLYRVNFVHTGALYKRRDPSPLLYAISNLVRTNRIKDRTLCCRFVGPISEYLMGSVRLIYTLGIENIVEFLPAVSYQKSLGYMMDSDVLILLQPFTRLQIPGKFFDYICFDKPILGIGEKESAVENLISEHFGTFADYHDINCIENAILSFCQRGTPRKNNIDIERKAFDISKSIKIFEEILEW